MAKPHNRNDSSQMKASLQHDDDQKNRNRKPDPLKQQDSKDSRGPGSSSSDGSRCAEDDKPKTSDQNTDLMRWEDGATSVTAGSRCAEDDKQNRNSYKNDWTRRDDDASSCCQLDSLRRLPKLDIKLGPLNFSRSHTVLINVDIFKQCGPVPQDGRDLWDRNFVKMPCSPSSKLDSKFKFTQVSRWKLIYENLKALANKATASVDEVAEAIFKYNPKYKGQWSFDALSRFVERIPKIENDFEKLFPRIAALALDLPEQVKKAVPLLQRGHPASITLSQVQISCLLANAFYCTFPHRNSSGPGAEYHSYPSINFTRLFADWSERKKEKLRAVMHYFKKVLETKPEGLVTFQRCCLRDTDVPHWWNCKETLDKLHLTSQGSIETEGTGMLQVDFASSWIGGGVLDSGLIQEEILFLMNPELIVARLFTEKLADNECLIITGCQTFSQYSGYSDRFEWAGPYDDLLERDEWARLNRQILAMDALRFKHRRDQYNMGRITRELNKVSHFVFNSFFN
ncbi:poly(ADP-ribose) glycohydrolase isoform X2 [Austrofundulus limnaeus]|uniref:poly(ADP-ribose) glycohydrolase n=1 Tax=Austrofundulus limnaeus TaxID=52670 RepID=A0A2I4CQ29_AUSLI|nr:PREDICTED: poly(ADP-ribose) glycohydrolase-like isoform X2 [Austrofundulus limnaeus]